MRWPRVLSLLFFLPFLVELQVSAVWDSNEAFYIQTPREMAARGDWIVPSFNHQPRLNKPPLSYWLVGALQAAISDPVAAERWGLALVAGASLVCIFLLGRRITGSGAGGLLTLGVLATSFRFLVLSRRLMIDTLLLFCLLAALTAFLDWLERDRKGAFLLTAVFLGLGFLTKGPVVGIAVLILLAFLLVSGRLALLHKAPWGWAALILALLCLPWYGLLAWRLGPEVLWDFFLRENLGRFTYLDFGPRRGPFYYLGVFLADFAPWSVLFLGSLPWWATRLRREWRDRKRSAGSALVPAHGILMGLWIVTWILLFSLSRNKQEYYILPVYPVAACWVANWLGAQRVSRLWAGLAGVPVWLAALVLATLGSSLLGAPSAIWLFLGFPILFTILALTHRWLAAATCLSIFFSAALLVFTGPLEAYRPVREFAARIEAGAGDDVRVGYYRLTSPSLTVYLNRPIEELYTPEEAGRLFAGEEEIWLLVEEGELPVLQELSSGKLEIVDRRPLLSTRLADILGRLHDPGPAERYALLVHRPPR